MTSKTKILILAILMAVLLGQTAFAQTFFFIHVPRSSSSATQADIDAGLQEIADLVSEAWSQANGGEPKVCWMGFAGPWDAGAPAQPNHAGAAANNLGGDCGMAVSIEYCAIDLAMEELMGPDSDCDIVIAMGEGGDDSDPEPGFCLEEHGGGNPTPDCAGNLPTNPGPICNPGGCEGTDWDEPIGCMCTYEQWVYCNYEGEIKVKPGTGAGDFLCGYTCCQRNR